MVPGMGAKISVLIYFSFVFLLKLFTIQLTGFFGKIQLFQTRQSNPILKGNMKVKCVYFPVDSAVWKEDAGQIL